MGSACSCDSSGSNAACIPGKYEAVDVAGDISTFESSATGVGTGGTPSDPNIRRVLMIYTGGTIGMKASDHGYICVKGYLPQVLRDLPMFNDKEFDLEKEGASNTIVIAVRT